MSSVVTSLRRTSFAGAAILWLQLLYSDFCFAQTPLTNGLNVSDILSANVTNFYSFDANAGDNIALRIGTTSFSARMDLYGPGGVFLRNSSVGQFDGLLLYSITNSGTFTVGVRSQTAGGSGSYTLRFARMPGEFVVTPGDQGGPLTNGAIHSGSMPYGDMDQWSFYAQAGDAIELRAGNDTGGIQMFSPELRLYGPDGALQGVSITASSSARDGRLSVVATNSGTFVAIIHSCYLDSQGSYKFNLVKIPGDFAVSAGDQGGVLTNGISEDGTIALGDLDPWKFSACEGQTVVLQCQRLSGTFMPRLRVYGRNGTLMATASSPTNAIVNLSITNSGIYTALIDGTTINESGNYRLTGLGIGPNGLGLCSPTVSDSTLRLIGVGGVPNAPVLMLAATNLNSPVADWQVVGTNQSDQFGVCGYTNGIDPGDSERYFRLLQP